MKLSTLSPAAAAARSVAVADPLFTACAQRIAALKDTTASLKGGVWNEIKAAAKVAAEHGCNFQRLRSGLAAELKRLDVKPATVASYMSTAKAMHETLGYSLAEIGEDETAYADIRASLKSNEDKAKEAILKAVNKALRSLSLETLQAWAAEQGIGAAEESAEEGEEQQAATA